MTIFSLFSDWNYTQTLFTCWKNTEKYWTLKMKKWKLDKSKNINPSTYISVWDAWKSTITKYRTFKETRNGFTYRQNIEYTHFALKRVERSQVESESPWSVQLDLHPFARHLCILKMYNFYGLWRIEYYDEQSTYTRALTTSKRMQSSMQIMKTNKKPTQT